MKQFVKREGCDCMVEDDPITGEERVMTHSANCIDHPMYGDDSA